MPAISVARNSLDRWYAAGRYDQPEQRNPPPPDRLHGEQGEVDAPEAVSHHDEDRQPHAPREIPDGHPFRERDEESAAPLDDHEIVPRREAPALNGVPTYNDFSPRVGAVYDLMGNGRTAIRFSTGRYVGLSRGDFTSRFHPFNSSINSASRVLRSKSPSV